MTTDETADECSTCGEIEGVEGECANSKRPCGHHCNHVWSHDECDWCGAHFGEGGEITYSTARESERA